MKKIGLICAVTLAGMSLAACGNQSYNLKKLKAEHARLLKQSKDHKDHHKTHKSKKQNASSKRKTILKVLVRVALTKIAALLVKIKELANTVIKRLQIIANNKITLVHI